MSEQETTNLFCQKTVEVKDGDPIQCEAKLTTDTAFICTDCLWPQPTFCEDHYNEHLAEIHGDEDEDGEAICARCGRLEARCNFEACKVCGDGPFCHRQSCIGNHMAVRHPNPGVHWFDGGEHEPYIATMSKEAIITEDDIVFKTDAKKAKLLLRDSPHLLDKVSAVIARGMMIGEELGIALEADKGGASDDAAIVMWRPKKFNGWALPSDISHYRLLKMCEMAAKEESGKWKSIEAGILATMDLDATARKGDIFLATASEDDSRSVIYRSGIGPSNVISYLVCSGFGEDEWSLKGIIENQSAINPPIKHGVLLRRV